MIHSLPVFLGLAAFGGGGGGAIDFSGVQTTGQNYGSHAAVFVVCILVVLILAGIASVLASSRGKSEMVQFIGLGAFLMVCVGILFTWAATSNAAACVLGFAAPGVSI